MATTTIGTIQLLAKIDTANYKRGAAEIDKANRDIEGSTQRADGAVTKTGKALTGIAVRGFKVATAGALAFGTAVTAMTLKGGISRALNIEDAQAKLRGLGHDAKSVSTIMDNALNAVRGTAFGLDAAATTAANAVASGVKPGKELAGVLKTVANTAALAGRGMDEIGAIFNKVAASNKVQMDVINQLHDAGVPALALLSKEIGKTAEETAQMASDGKINFATFERAMRKGVGNAAVEMGKTTRGSISNMGAAFSRLGAKIVEDFVPKFRGGIQSITKFVDDNSGNIVRGISVAIDKIKQFGLAAIEVGKQVGAYLGPKLIALYNTFTTQIIPILMDLWHNVLKPLVPVIGTVLVVAIGLLIDQLNIWYNILSWVYTALKNGNPIIWAMVGSLTALYAAFALTKAVTAAGAAITFFSNVTIPTAMAKVGALKLLIATPMVMPAIAIGAAIASLALLRNEAHKTIDAVAQAKQSANSLQASNNAAEAAIRSQLLSPDPNVRQRAQATLYKLGMYQTGGFTGRGAADEVAGIVHKGEYVLPKSMVDQTTGKPKETGRGSSVNVTINLSGVMTDSIAGLREVGKKLIRAVNDELAAKGQQTIAGGAI